MNIKNPLLIVLFITTLFACNNSAPVNRKDVASNIVMSEPTAFKNEAPSAEGDTRTADAIPTPQQAANESAKKIIKDGTMAIKTEDIVASKKNMDGILKQLNAYYETEELQNTESSISYNLRIRIPANNFEALISSIENGSDEITLKNIQARDVTEEFVDITTRLANKRAYLQRYTELLSKANNVEDILKIEENIRTLQEEIESTEGRLKYLSDQVAFSTLSLNLFKEKPYVYKPQVQDKFTERVKKAVSNGWTFIVDLIVWLINGWAVFTVLFIVLYFVRKRMRKNRANKS